VTNSVVSERHKKAPEEPIKVLAGAFFCSQESAYSPSAWSAASRRSTVALR